ncbi:MAG: GAF domain-containing protein [Chloroflexia bacterium]
MLEDKYRRVARAGADASDDAQPLFPNTVTDETTQKIYTLNAISASISREADLDRVLAEALDWVLEVSGGEAGTIFLVNKQENALELTASKGLSERFLAEHKRLGYGVGLSWSVVQSGKPLAVEDLSTDERTIPVALSEGIRSYVGVPLRADNRVIGVLNVLSRNPRHFTSADIDLLLSIGNQIGVAAAKARLTWAQTESREQLRQKMNQLAELLKVSATFRASAPLDQVLNAVCSAIRSALGFRLVELNLLEPVSQMMVPTAFAGFSPAEQERLRRIVRPREFYDRVMQPKFRVSNSYFISHRDGLDLGGEWAFLPDIQDRERGEDEWHRHDALAVPLQDRDGQLVGMLYVDDPDDRKLPTVEQVEVVEMFVQQATLAVENARLLDELQRSEAKYRLLTETAGDLIFLLEPDGSFAFLSSSTAKILGYEPHELIGRRFADLLAPNSVRSAPAYLIDPSSTEDRQGRCVVELLRRDGAGAFLEIDSMPVYEDGRLSGEQGIGRDISEKKRMEREIARRQRQLRRFQRREEQLTGYAATVIAAQEEERKRIARDLHDDTAQALIALSRQIEVVRDVMQHSPESAELKLNDLRTLTEQTLASVRRFSRDLRPSVLDDLGLVPALEWLVAETARRHGITTRLKVRGDERRLQPEIELACFRITQEALNNTAKRAGQERSLS